MIKISNLEGYDSDKIVPYKEAIKIIRGFKFRGKKVGLCHGAFDLLHPGHVRHFESARKLCDVLFVSITKDKFVSLRKGSNRPVYTDRIRAYMSAAVRFVDYVVITDFRTGVEAITALKPDFYIKGPDFADKMTAGIIAERNAIKSAGGKIVYTSDPKFSTTEVVEYISRNPERKSLLVILDRDGTLIEDKGFLGRNSEWKTDIKLKNDVIEFILFLQSNYNTSKMVITNQSGVARWYFDCKTVEEINKHLDELMRKHGVSIDNWQYCPYVDSKYTNSKKEEIKFNPLFVKDNTKRKPNAEMVNDGLEAIGRKLDDFDRVIVLGDKDEDMKLAGNINARFINVSDKSFEDMAEEFRKGQEIKHL